MKNPAFSRRSLLASAFALTVAGMALQGPARADEFKMGLLVPGSIGEEGWSRIGYDALKRVEKELGAKVGHVELPPRSRREHERGKQERDEQLPDPVERQRAEMAGRAGRDDPGQGPAGRGADGSQFIDRPVHGV